MMKDKNVCQLLAAGGLSAARAHREVQRRSSEQREDGLSPPDKTSGSGF